jgi:hypothetical protein
MPEGCNLFQRTPGSDAAAWEYRHEQIALEVETDAMITEVWDELFQAKVEVHRRVNRSVYLLRLLEETTLFG